jgi:hypothetical protein
VLNTVGGGRAVIKLEKVDLVITDTEFACNGSSIYDESMTLTWKEPATPNGYIQHYIIYDATRNMSIPTNGSVLKQLIVNLSPGRKNVVFFLLT